MSVSASDAVKLYRALKGVIALPEMTTGFVIVADVGQPLRLIVKAILPGEAVSPIVEVVKDVAVGPNGEVSTLPFAEELDPPAVIGGPPA